METVKISVPIQGEVEIPRCPACGCDPVISPRIKKDERSIGGCDVKISGYDVTCACCGLGATLEIWLAMASYHDKPFLPDAEPEVE